MQLNKVVVTDSSCFILFDKINALNILNDLFGIVLTTPEVAAEYGSPLPEWVIIQKVDDFNLQQKFYQHVDKGEASAIALACEVHPDFLILDDLEARKFAAKLGLPVKGSAGVLVQAKQNGIIATVKPYLDLMQQTNFRIASSVIETVLKEAGEY
ncbi:DUF3368 domain-containing protein [Mucilaginibacter mali]|uniref:DUF3368 domain-containing protein n=1 Tax=Mucilaginibacter mali TaxID=2740462 RepID=A0A7D4PTK0_9SPHI|nr:DUF3368 domain-containing protein [Mucilaginibacter mali]QKJ29743.1 DUF3368 domain-containing protein [Mucilaginibacter mali]